MCLNGNCRGAMGMFFQDKGGWGGGRGLNCRATRGGIYYKNAIHLSMRVVREVRIPSFTFLSSIVPHGHCIILQVKGWFYK